MDDIKQIITRLGGPVSVGKALGLTHSAVCQWEKIPADYTVILEKHSIERGLPVLREEMRPDLFRT
jgi:DNA-binding transcriptional regulator YdaS (Cro superfamily)